MRCAAWQSGWPRWPTGCSTQLVCSPALERGEGRRQRLFDAGAGSYWPRLIVTDADRHEDAAAPECQPSRRRATRQRGATVLADRHAKFLYVGQRARAESVLQQRQPGLIERLVRQQIHNPVWNEDFGRMLFQLMVPHDFKDAGAPARAGGAGGRRAPPPTCPGS